MSVAIIGGGQAAASLIKKLVCLKYSGKISLFCEESYLPYERPPLSKNYLLNHNEKINYINSKNFYEENNIDVYLNTSIKNIDVKRKIINSNTDSFVFDHLVIATGAKAGKLPKEFTKNLENILTLRSINDANNLKNLIKNKKKILIIGGGYIGLEAAASLSERNLSVLLIEQETRILQRVASSSLSNCVKEIFDKKRVSILEKTIVSTIEQKKGKLFVNFDNNTSEEFDLILVGIGSAPNVNLANSAGINIDNGVWTNKYGQTSHKNIWAIGDCSSFPFQGQQIRLENIQHAIDSAEIVADNLLQNKKIYLPVPTFWSKQFDNLIQIVGLNNNQTETIIRESNSAMSKSFWSYKNEKLVTVETINDSKTYLLAKRMVSNNISPSKEFIKNNNSNLKAILKSR